MTGMIFAAGLGTRLRPLTDSIPKCLIEIAGKPMLQRVIDAMRAAGIDRVVVNTHHHADMVIEWIGRHPQPGVKLLVSDESDLLLDTGGGVVKALPLLSGHGPVMLHNADVLTDYPLRRLVEMHNGDATLLTREHPSGRALLFDDAGRMRGWTDRRTGEVKPTGLNISGLMSRGFAGVHILSEKAISRLARYVGIPVFSITSFYIDACRTLDVRSTPVEPWRWIDIGSPQSLAIARCEWENSGK